MLYYRPLAFTAYEVAFSVYEEMPSRAARMQARNVMKAASAKVKGSLPA
jgi:hypothetical protein